MKTIKEAVEILQQSVSAAIPGMVVSVNISLTAGNIAKEEDINIPDEIPADLARDIDLAALRSFLNAYAKKAGASKAINLVKKYTGSESKNPADIQPDKYMSLVQDVQKEYPDWEISFDDKEAA